MRPSSSAWARFVALAVAFACAILGAFELDPALRAAPCIVKRPRMGGGNHLVAHRRDAKQRRPDSGRERR